MARPNLFASANCCTHSPDKGGWKFSSYLHVFSSSKKSIRNSVGELSKFSSQELAQFLNYRIFLHFPREFPLVLASAGNFSPFFHCWVNGQTPFSSCDFPIHFSSSFNTKTTNKIAKFNYIAMGLAIHYKLTNNLIDYLMKTEFFRWDEFFAHPISRKISFS